MLWWYNISHANWPRVPPCWHHRAHSMHTKGWHHRAHMTLHATMAYHILCNLTNDTPLLAPQSSKERHTVVVLNIPSKLIRGTSYLFNRVQRAKQTHEWYRSDTDVICYITGASKLPGWTVHIVSSYKYTDRSPSSQTCIHIKKQVHTVYTFCSLSSQTPAVLSYLPLPSSTSGLLTFLSNLSGILFMATRNPVSNWHRIIFRL